MATASCRSYYIRDTSRGEHINILSSTNISWAILNAASLSFLRVGIQPSTPEWGVMISAGSPFIVSGQWWMSFFPGVALILMTAGSGWGHHKAVYNSYLLNFLNLHLLASVIRTTTQRQTNLHPVLASLLHARTLHVLAEPN
jgi:hypothetical protein